MSKLFSVLLIIVATCAIAPMALGQGADNPPSKGRAPQTENGIGRADVRVFDNNSNPIKYAYVKLESSRSDGYFCESWGETDGDGIIALLPIHMGSLKFKIKAKGYRPQELDVPASHLGDPVRVTLRKK
jgi:hypothetical protein